MMFENIGELRWTLDAVVREVGRTGREVIIVDRDGETELAVIISVADYERLHEHAGDVASRAERDEAVPGRVWSSGAGDAIER